MNETSLAAQAVASGPGTVAPPSFDGHGWLVALNMGVMTFGCVAGLMVIGMLLTDARKRRRQDVGWAPARIFRVIGLLFASGITLRCGAEALSLWGWNPREADATARFLLIKRLVDPFAACFGLGGLGLYVMSMPGVFTQLRKEPLPLRMWQAWPTVKRMLAVGGLCFVAAIGVVSTR
ncbi:hypothetical protein [Sphingomonas dokdonensis]|uniref:Uncharacterized protein n=1 Tax=Sphingomonas dokdonensis TaxID=344880 RepID=A0A245ZHL1_9SPHN|nr:hypothetical protein [Sphingomonas dokdonensis]OWK29220.1 hypothetical protein SPDO_22010 [Sphingomonas dokdonensis]